MNVNVEVVADEYDFIESDIERLAQFLEDGRARLALAMLVREDQDIEPAGESVVRKYGPKGTPRCASGVTDEPGLQIPLPDTIEGLQGVRDEIGRMLDGGLHIGRLELGEKRNAESFRVKAQNLEEVEDLLVRMDVTIVRPVKLEAATP